MFSVRRPAEPDLYISGENTFTAMHGDRVVARLVTEDFPV